MTTSVPARKTACAGRACMLAITHEYGLSTSVHDSMQDAEAALLDYVQSWWDAEAGEGVPMPEDPGEAIAAYFLSHAPHEDYNITAP